MRRLLDKCGGPKAYRAKLEYDQAYRQFEAIDNDPESTPAQIEEAWDAVEEAENRLKWWQSRSIGYPPYASKWE